MRDANWYDAGWLNAYHRAIDCIESTAPDRVDQFVRSFDPLRTRPDFTTKFIKEALAPDVLEQVRSIVRSVPMSKMELHEMRTFGRFVVHDLPEFTALQERMTEQVSRWAGEPLAPSYNFLSLYTHTGECKPHLDAPSAKWTLDLCIDQSEGWPIYLSDVQPWPDMRKEHGDPKTANDFSPFILEPGDAILFSGSSQWHYREKLSHDGKKRHCDLLFMHFIPAGTEQLVNPANWAAMFNLPKLAKVEGIENAR